MAQGNRKVLAAAGVIAVLLAASASQAADPALTVVVHVTDLASHDASDLARAHAEAKRIFAESGVRLLWVDISEGPQAHVCDGMNVSVVLLSPFLVRQWAIQGLGKTVLGSALPEDGRAFIYSERIYALASGRRVDAGVLLGRVVAHEVGHLMLGSDHSRSGLMTVSIDTDSLGLQALFTRRQASSIRGLLASKAGAREPRDACGGGPAIAEARK